MDRTRSTLIPVLVTGIQQRRVCGAGESFQPTDLVWLDSCDEHRNEGGGDARALPQPRLGTARHL
ncbi:IS481 family transposase, partial [Sinorhizobium meliloti]